MLMKDLKYNSQSHGGGRAQTWKDHTTHYLNALNDPWYQNLFKLQSDIALHTHNFFNSLRFCLALLPITTGSISSPMGLGSDSLPVKVNIANVATYLADSMQFMLEYALRFYEGGVYYLMPSFRGEDADKRHLCQFYHIEAEIPGAISSKNNFYIWP